MADNNSLNNIPYAKWLEDALQHLITLPVTGVCLSATLKGGEVYIDYHDISMMDKLKIAGLIQQDAMIDSLAASGYIDYADEDGEADGEEKE